MALASSTHSFYGDTHGWLQSSFRGIYADYHRARSTTTCFFLYNRSDHLRRWYRSRDWRCSCDFNSEAVQLWTGNNWYNLVQRSYLAALCNSPKSTRIGHPFGCFFLRCTDIQCSTVQLSKRHYSR